MNELLLEILDKHPGWRIGFTGADNWRIQIGVVVPHEDNPKQADLFVHSVPRDDMLNGVVLQDLRYLVTAIENGEAEEEPYEDGDEPEVWDGL